MGHDERPLEWMGDSRNRLIEMPLEVKKAIGHALHLAQNGEHPPHAKPFKGVGSGVFEIAKRFDTNTYRAVYAVKIGKRMYVLHAFQKRSKKGIATTQADVDLIKSRYREAQELEKLYEQKEKDDGQSN